MNVKKKKLKVTCIFHKGCMDGWMSALPIWLGYHNTAEMVFVPAHYSDTPPNVDGCDYVYIVDFSYKPEVIANWPTGNAEGFLIDHHANAIKELTHSSELNLTENRTIKNGLIYDSDNRCLTAYLAFNEGKPHSDQASGAGLVMDFLDSYRGSINVGSLDSGVWSDIRDTIKISQSYDLWHHDGKEMHDNTYLSMFFKNWETVNREKFNRMLSHPQESHTLMMELAAGWMATSLQEKLDYGKSVVIKQGALCRALCETAYEVKLPVVGYDGVKIGCILGENLGVSVSMLGSIATREYDWDVMVMIAAVKENDYVLSMRSNENAKNVDVADICEQIAQGPYGLSGGGHRNAAGCTIAKNHIVDVLTRVISV